MTCMLAAMPLQLTAAAPPPVNLVWTNGMPYAPVTLTTGQSLVLSWPGAVRFSLPLCCLLQWSEHRAACPGDSTMNADIVSVWYI